MTRFLWICLFGAIGTGLRYGIQTWAARWPNFPYGTLIVNVVGCFFIAAIRKQPTTLTIIVPYGNPGQRAAHIPTR